MLHTRLGLFDTPPDRNEVRLGLALFGLLFAALAVLSALPDIRLGEIEPFIPIVDTAMLVGDALTATLLFVQASVFRSRALAVLAAGFLFEALMLVAHMLTFPGAFAPDGLLGAQLNTTAWIAIAWRAAPPIAILLYVWLKQAEPSERPIAERTAVRIVPGVAAAVLLAAAVVILTTRGHDLLPQIFVDRQAVNRAVFLRIACVVTALLILALATLFRKRTSVLDLWLLVALSGCLAHALLNIQATGRFTVSFYAQFSMLLFSHFVVMLALMAEAHRLYARLALATAARARERESRLVSVDAAVGAIAHEVGQPLSAISMNVGAGLNWLTRPRPDQKRAIESMRTAAEAARRAHDVIKSVRASFARQTGAASEFDLNDLVRFTAALLHGELADEKIALHFELEEDLPPLLADRVLIQRVLVNLITNAIESLAATEGRQRRLVIRSASLGGEHLLLEVSDNGVGIPGEDAARIFEAFFTTKATGTGLGLSLCRSIVEARGGDLWASHHEGHGATFHLQLPTAAA